MICDTHNNAQNFCRVLIITLTLIIASEVQAQGGDVPDTVYVDMAAISQPFLYNRLGAAQPTGMIFALTSDLDHQIPEEIPESMLGNVRLKEGKRPRPIVLRANVGDILKIRFTNLLLPYYPDSVLNAYGTDKPNTLTQFDARFTNTQTRAAGVHILGTEMIGSINSDGSWVGGNASSLANPGERTSYTLLAPEEGVFMLFSTGTTIGQGGQKAGQLSTGLFGSLNVQPDGAEWYRSQVTEADLDLAITGYNQMIDGSSYPKKVSKATYANLPDSLQAKCFPIVNYDATFANGRPILKMYKDTIVNGRSGRKMVYTDLTAIITGPNRGDFSKDNPSPSFFEVPASPDRRRPYREFGIHYHESPWTVYAFPYAFTNDSMVRDSVTYKEANTLATGNDNFAINYGSGGIGAEIYANRIGVGPMADCADCAYEEFFLSSWAVGDPATVVDIPANAAKSVNESLQNQFLLSTGTEGADTTMRPSLGVKATKVLYPDDPSNVYHSYMNDHVKFRVTHTGAALTHVHHQHAHQWLHTPNSDEGHYMDSQTINPGSSYTLEMVYDGSGNLNKTVGDQIFHCHFYPHFAAGMWALWRVHDVLELGTKLDNAGRAAVGSRALPDGEIQRGTAIPGLVPIPKMAMAPIPAKVHIEGGEVVIDNDASDLRNPGYPFYIPGIAGSRPPHPPLDFAVGDIFDEKGNKTGTGTLNGGLPRNVMYTAKVPFERHNEFDWTKIVDTIKVIELPEEGTAVEKVAMATHAIRKHKTLTPDGEQGDFILNGLPPVSGAPFADPAINLAGNSVGTKRTYKAAVIQLDVVLNKLGWHYPQQRIISLWGDVSANIEGIKPPEPFFFRANSEEYVEYWHTNLVPEYYELDDYQVRTPTDVIGQHIHLVKFDVTSSDGAANGWNYEDGTLAPDLVRERIKGINNGGKRFTYQYQPGKAITDTSGYAVNTDKLSPHAPNPIWGTAPEGQDWTGAQTTIQRWYADPLLNNRGKDRTLRTVFTHDHFGPSTHQQIGLYAGLLVEPKGSKWINPVNGETLSRANNGTTRPVRVNTGSGTKTLNVSDGGPTSWQANIVIPNDSSYREFMLEFQDTQQAYLPGSKDKLDPYPSFPEKYEGKAKTDFLDSVKNYTGWMDPSNAINSVGYPELISFGFRGTYSMNYRSEPIPMRVSMDSAGSRIQTADSSLPNAGNLSYAYSSIKRGDPLFNTQPVGGSLIPGSSTFRFPVDSLGPDMGPMDPYTPLFRAYENDKVQIRTLVGAHVTSHFFNVHGINWLFEPSNINSGYRSTQNMSLSEHFEMNFRVPVTKNSQPQTDYLYQTSSSSAGRQGGNWGIIRTYDSVQDNLVPLPNNDVKTNPISAMDKTCGCPSGAKPRSFDVVAISVKALQDSIGVSPVGLIYNQQYKNYEPEAIVFVERSVLQKKVWTGEPLVLRANAGDCITVKLENMIPENHVSNSLVFNYQPNLPKAMQDTLQVSLATSSDVGLHTDLLSYDAGSSDADNIGTNQVQTVGRGEKTSYTWYAGRWENGKASPVEFGTVILASSDPMIHYSIGLFGTLVIEPQGSYWTVDENMTSSANVYADAAKTNLLFREFVVQMQDNINVTSVVSTRPTVTSAINYKAEPMANRLPTSSGPVFALYSLDSLTSYIKGYAETPNFSVTAGDPLRIRLSHPGGSGNGMTFSFHGHVWQEEPYVNNSRKLGINDTSQWFGYRDQMGPLNSFDLLINSAGGDGKVPGDYLYRNMVNDGFQVGMWGVVSVLPDTVPGLFLVTKADKGKKTTTIYGVAGPDLKTGQLPETVSLVDFGKDKYNASVEPDGSWVISGVKNKNLVKDFKIYSSIGGVINIDGTDLYKLPDGSVIEEREYVGPQPPFSESRVQPAPVEGKPVVIK